MAGGRQAGDVRHCHPAHRTTDEICVVSDREILVELYNATDGPNWKNDDNWLTDAPQWHALRVLPFSGCRGVVHALQRKSTEGRPGYLRVAIARHRRATARLCSFEVLAAVDLVRRVPLPRAALRLA